MAKQEGIKVRALRQGTHNGFREPNEEFNYTGITQKEDKDGKMKPYFPSWMKPLEEVKNEAAPEPDKSGGDDDKELEKVRAEYEVVFKEKPHHNTKIETLRKQIEDRKAQLAE